MSSDHLNAMWWTGYLPKFHCDKDGVYALEIMPYHFDNYRISKFTESEENDFFEYLSYLSSIITDGKEVLKYFEAWIAQHGSFYLSLIRDRLSAWPIDINERDAVRNLLPPRNCFTCESHNDLITSYLRLVEEYRTSEAIKYWPKIEELQKPSFAEKYWKNLK